MRRGAYRVPVAGAGGCDRSQRSEVHLAMAAAPWPRRAGNLAVVSVPCLELFLEQDAAYRAFLFPPGVPVATLEAG